MTSADGSYGVAVLNDCRYGWDHPDSSTLRLTLIHTPGVFENWSWVGDQSSQDLGHHTFGYALKVIERLGSESGTVWQAAQFNQPLLAFQTNPHRGELGKNFSFLQVIPGDMMRSSVIPRFNQTMVTAVKRAEETDEIIIRIRELCGERAGPVELAFPWSITAARELDGAEQPKGTATFKNKTLTTSLSPYQPKTFAVTLSTPSARVAKPSWQAVALPYNLDGVSLDSDRTNGDVDGVGNTLAGELIPDTIWNHGVGFVTGPKAAGEANLLTCRGQALALPSDDFNRLCLLATAVGGPAAGAFVIGDQSSEVSLQDYAEPIGRWNSRLIGDQFVEEKNRIAPAYILREPVGWVGTHRHSAADENESYQFTYLYLVELDIPKGARELKLADNDRMLVAAASVVCSKYDQVTPAQPLYDVDDAAIAKVTAQRTAFIDSMVVSLGSPYPGAAVHYTLDGTEPTATSASYVQPLVLKETTVLKARALHEHADDRYVTEVQFTQLIPRSASVLTQPSPGLICNYYEGEWRRLPDFDSLTPQKTAVVDSIVLPEFVRDEDYGLVMTGYVEVPADGLWDFYITSDDGSALYVGDSLVADNDGIHGPDEVGGMIALKAGLHPIRVRMFQCKGGKYLEVSMQGPGFEKQPIAPHLLFREGIDGSR
jgi:alpha-mannosidase